jgi:hypothetical protein
MPKRRDNISIEAIVRVRRHLLDLKAKIGAPRAIEASFMSDATSQTVYFYDRHPIGRIDGCDRGRGS